MNDKNFEILNRAFQALKFQTQIDYKNNKEKNSLWLFFNKFKKEFHIEFVKNLTNASIGLLAHRFQNSPHTLLITKYVNPNSADKLKELNIQFIDIYGNAYINEYPFFLFIKGNKPEKENFSSKHIFSSSGLKIVFLFLCCRQYLNAPYRDIAEKAAVALGTIGPLIDNLKESNFILDRGKLDRKLINCEQLIEKWVEAYSNQMRSKLIMGKYTSPKIDWWKNIQLNEFNAYWGNEIAAAKLTNYIKPEVITIYTGENSSKLQFTQKLQKDPAGKVEILKKFWNFDNDSSQNGLVPPLLIYADLIASGNSRNIEVAKIIYDKEFYRYLK